MKNLLNIRHVKICNFRSIKKIEIKNVGNINVFVGPNEGGKSNILKALEWFSKDDAMSDNDIPKNNGPKEDEVIVSITFEISDPQEYLQIVQGNIRSNQTLISNTTESKIIPRYLIVKKQKNGGKEFDFYDNSGNPTKVISSDQNVILRNVQEKIKKLNIPQIARDKIERYLRNTGLYKSDVDKIFNRLDMKKFTNNIQRLTNNAQLKQIFGKDISEIKNLKDKILNHNSINSLPSRYTYSRKKGNVRLKLNLKELVKSSIETYFVTELEDPLKKISTKKISLIDKLGIPKFTLYSEKIDLRGSVKKEKSWSSTITREKHPIYYMLFNVAKIQPSGLDSKTIRNARQYLKNRLRTISDSLNDTWHQKEIKFDPSFDSSELAIDIVDLDEKNREILNTFPEDRSDGFQWFLGYFITLDYIKKSEDNQILLLDDPGLYLHPKGQRDFLRNLEDLSKSNQVFYSTHLVSLFSEDYLDRVYLVESKKSNTKISKPWRSEHKAVTEPLRCALGLDIVIFKDTKKILFVEGMADKFIIEGIFHSMGKFGKWYVYPLFGSDDIEKNKVKERIKSIQSIKGFYEEKNFRFILDGDKKELMKDNTENIIFMGDKNQEMEDLIDKGFYLKCIREMYYPLFIENKPKIIKLDDVCLTKEENIDRKITKFLEDKFKEKKLGGFGKVDVAKYIKRKLISESGNIQYFKAIERNLKNL